MEFIIHEQPVSKKNSQQILVNRGTGRPFISPSKKYKEYEKAALRELTDQGLKYSYEKGVDFPLTGAYNVRCVFYMGTRRAVDLVNMLECACDVLVKAGVLEDDNCNIVISHDGSRVLYDKENPRTEIELTEFIL